MFSRWAGNFPMYIDKICPLDDYIASGVVDTSGITDANLKITQDTEGHQLGLSNGLNSYGIAYDPAMFAEAGVLSYRRLDLGRLRQRCQHHP